MRYYSLEKEAVTEDGKVIFTQEQIQYYKTLIKTNKKKALLIDL